MILAKESTGPQPKGDIGWSLEEPESLAAREARIEAALAKAEEEWVRKNGGGGGDA